MEPAGSSLDFNAVFCFNRLAYCFVKCCTVCREDSDIRTFKQHLLGDVMTTTSFTVKHDNQFFLDRKCCVDIFYIILGLRFLTPQVTDQDSSLIIISINGLLDYFKHELFQTFPQAGHYLMYPSVQGRLGNFSFHFMKHLQNPIFTDIVVKLHIRIKTGKTGK